jgi:hypothetical protein
MESPMDSPAGNGLRPPFGSTSFPHPGDLAPVRCRDLLTEERIAAELGVAVTTLRKWRTTGEGPAFVKVPGFRAPRYRRRDPEEWKASLPGRRSIIDARKYTT